MGIKRKASEKEFNFVYGEHEVPGKYLESDFLWMFYDGSKKRYAANLGITNM